MSVGRNVQFRSADNVLQAYRANNVPAFSVSAGTQLLTSYAGTDMEEGEQLLDKFLELLEQSKSAATYSVRVYKKLGKNEDINNKTAYHGSFNFNLTDRIVGSLSGLGANENGVSLARDFYDLKKQFEEQRQMIADLLEKLGEQSEDNGSEKPNIGETLLASVLPHLPLLIEKLFPPKSTEPGQQQINGIFLNYPETERERIDKALEQLAKHTKDLPGLMEKLARYAAKNPVGFALYQKYL